MIKIFFYLVSMTLAGCIRIVSLESAVPTAAESQPNPTLISPPIVVVAGTNFKDCDDCPTMVPIHGGSFDMGSSSPVEVRLASEGPKHRVSVASFDFGKTHITRGEFAAFVTATGYDAGAECYTFEEGKYQKRSGRSWRNPGFPQEDNHPVVCVSWHDAKTYAEWLSRKTGKNYRLPAEAEWEYAARAGTNATRYWGDRLNAACDYANGMDFTGKAQMSGVSWETHPCTDGYAYTAPVGSFKSNAFGLFDMIGNAWQWNEECWHANYNGAPIDGSVWQSGDCAKRVVRGGSWFNDPQSARSASRGGLPVGIRSAAIGIRLARSSP